MDLLITVIGNAVADTEFRERLLRDPLTALDEWGFRLTKGEIEMMQEVLPRASEEELRNKFQALHETLYAKNYCPTKRCSMSAIPTCDSMSEIWRVSSAARARCSSLSVGGDRFRRSSSSSIARSNSDAVWPGCAVAVTTKLPP